jgi:uncharacterized membrane protein YfcA
MLPDHFLLLFAAGLLAGTMNAAAGGGSFVTLPSLVFAGVPSVAANATSTVALFPGTLASAYAYRHDAKPFGHVSMRVLLAVMLAGGFTGAMLLLYTPSATFDRIIPWLLLFGALVFTFGPRVNAWLRRFVHIGPRTVVVVQFFLGTYAGYFGGAVGIMMMAAWSLLGVTDIRAMSAARMLLVGTANSVAVVIFIASKLVWWPQMLVMMGAGIVGGYFGARVARRVEPARIRMGISVLAFGMTAAVFYRQLKT